MKQIPVLTFFNNKSGVGKTSLIYHLSWMFASLGKRIVIVDIDPQCNLSAAFLEEVLNKQDIPDLKQDDDPYCLATIKHFRSLIPMGQEKRKPIFNLTSADGAIGSHAGAVREAYNDFKRLAEKIAAKIDLPLNSE